MLQVNIQQIPKSTADTDSKPQTSVSKDTSGAFESIMRKTVTERSTCNAKDTEKTGKTNPSSDSKLSGGKTNDVKPADNTEENKNTQPTDAFTVGINLSAVQAMLQQFNVSVAQPSVSTPQASPAQAEINILPVSAQQQVTQPVLLSQTVNALSAADTQAVVALSAADTQPAVQTSVMQTAVSPMASAAVPSVQSAEQIPMQDANAKNSTAVQVSAGNSAIPAVEVQSPIEQSVVLPQASVQEPAVAQTVLKTDSTGNAKPENSGSVKTSQDSTVVLSEKSDMPVIPVVEANQQNQPNSQMAQSSDTGSKQNVFVAAGKSQSVDVKQKMAADTAETSEPLEKTELSGQTPALASDLFQTNQVIIPISDASSKLQQAVSTQVTDQIVANYQKNNNQFEMNLYPNDLGKVTVKLSMESGVLSVSILAENPKTQSLLLSNSDQIQSLLQTTVQHSVQVVDASQGKAWYQQPQDNSQSQAQQQAQEQNKRDQERSPYRTDRNDMDTEDFLSMMQQLRTKTYAI